MLQSVVKSDQRKAIYWQKRYLFVFIIIVKAEVVPTKTDWNAMNLTRLKKERKKERRVKEEEKEERRGKTKSQMLSVVSELYP